MGAKILLQGEANVMTRSIRLEVPIIDVAPLVAGAGDQEEAAAALRRGAGAIAGLGRVLSTTHHR